MPGSSVLFEVRKQIKEKSDLGYESTKSSNPLLVQFLEFIDRIAATKAEKRIQFGVEDDEFVDSSVLYRAAIHFHNSSVHSGFLSIEDIPVRENRISEIQTEGGSIIFRMVNRGYHEEIEDCSYCSYWTSLCTSNNAYLCNMQRSIRTNNASRTYMCPIRPIAEQ